MILSLRIIANSLIEPLISKRQPAICRSVLSGHQQISPWKGTLIRWMESRAMYGQCARASTKAHASTVRLLVLQHLYTRGGASRTLMARRFAITNPVLGLPNARNVTHISRRCGTNNIESIRLCAKWPVAQRLNCRRIASRNSANNDEVSKVSRIARTRPHGYAGVYSALF
jgi:hypothetical protein